MLINSGVSAEDEKRQYGNKGFPKVWVASNAAAVSSLQLTAAPVLRGDLVLDSANKTIYICSTAPASATDAVFNQML